MPNHSWENVYFEKNSQWEPPHFSIKQKKKTTHFPKTLENSSYFPKNGFDIECIY